MIRATIITKEGAIEETFCNEREDLAIFYARHYLACKAQREIKKFQIDIDDSVWIGSDRYTIEVIIKENS